MQKSYLIDIRLFFIPIVIGIASTKLGGYQVLLHTLVMTLTFFLFWRSSDLAAARSFLRALLFALVILCLMIVLDFLLFEMYSIVYYQNMFTGILSSWYLMMYVSLIGIKKLNPVVVLFFHKDD